MESPFQTPPTSASSISTRRKFSLPLSGHGMPKTPAMLSPGSSLRSHRFSVLRSPTLSSTSSPPMTPMSPLMSPPMSPPMSAKSFGTFIESEPSTPAYSPRVGMSNWDSSTLVLLSPVSNSTSPAIPQEPKWEMIIPTKKTKKSTSKTKASTTFTKTIAMETSLSSHPINPIQEEPQKENLPPKASETTDPDAEEKAKEEQPAHSAPLEKLASRMKSMLRRKSSSEKNEKKSDKRQRGYQELHRMETVHWTEM